MGGYRRSNWYCGICGSEFDEDDNAITRCSCGTFYGECCARECIICDQPYCPECSDGRTFECCSSYVCDSCLDKIKIEEECQDCGEELYECPGCNSIYCVGCDEVKKNHKIQDLPIIEKK